MNHSNRIRVDLTEDSLRDAIEQIKQPISFRPRVMHIADWQLKEYFGWTDDIIKLRHKAGA